MKYTETSKEGPLGPNSAEKKGPLAPCQSTGARPGCLHPLRISFRNMASAPGVGQLVVQLAPPCPAALHTHGPGAVQEVAQGPCLQLL